jgi:hypothetical protein
MSGAGQLAGRCVQYLPMRRFWEHILAASLPLRSAELLAGPRWLNRWWPSRRLRSDPLHDLRVQERYAPVSISNWKLIPPVARNLLARRVPQALCFNAECRLTVIVPFRDREQHLQQLIPPLTSVLAQQRLAHKVLIVEQLPGELFNRGRLLNIGMHHAAGYSDYYCLHDVDAVPMTADYRCPSQPLRLVHKFLDSSGERCLPSHYFSGAVSICKEQAFAANGFSNDYWGWGKEDDDFYFRLLRAGFLCYYDLCGTYRNLPNPSHQQVPRGVRRPRYVSDNRERRSRLLRGLTDPASDGLTTLRYQVVEACQERGYERIKVRW